MRGWHGAAGPLARAAALKRARRARKARRQGYATRVAVLRVLVVIWETALRPLGTRTTSRRFTRRSPRHGKLRNVLGSVRRSGVAIIWADAARQCAAMRSAARRRGKRSTEGPHTRVRNDDPAGHGMGWRFHNERQLTVLASVSASPAHDKALMTVVRAKRIDAELSVQGFILEPEK
ncbi:hypothetical protein B0H10DRAFT_1946910 [Mycena sp. CBHHK59/15]|nr:hypothetical protein B0H10DRAFT_1946910 [Mycena sp. CBHHK59/15]